MNLKDARCTNCGAHLNLEPQKTMATCDYCHSTIMVSNAVELALVEVDKTKDLERYRTLLNDAIQKNSIGEILRQSNQIKDIIPSDFTANYYFAYAKQAQNEPSFMKAFLNSTLPATPEEINDVVNHMIHRSDLRDKPVILSFLTRISPESVTRYEEAHKNRARQENQYANVKRDIFICHSSYDRAVAERIVETLEKEGFTCWISTRNLRPEDSENYWENIRKAIKNTHLFLVVSSESAMLSKDVQREIEISQERKQKRFEYKIDDTPQTVLFKHAFDGIKWVDGSESPLSHVNKIPDRVYRELQRSKSQLNFRKTTLQPSNNVSINKWNKRLIMPLLVGALVVMTLIGLIVFNSGIIGSEPVFYRVTFRDYDGTYIRSQSYEAGSDIAYPEMPEFSEERPYFEFVGWSERINVVTEDISIDALYEPVTYSVQFIDYDGTIIDSEIVEHGDNVPSPAEPSREGYIFRAWNSSLSNIDSNRTIRPIYDRLSFEVTYLDYDGSVIETYEVNYGDTAPTPITPDREGYSFDGWNQSIENITSDLVINPSFEIKTFTVTFIDHDERVISTQVIEFGDSAFEPTPPTRENYTFEGWSESYTNITEDKTINTIYTQVPPPEFSIENIILNFNINDQVAIKGTVSSVFDEGFFIFDGSDHLGVWIGSGGTGGGLVQLGDEVRVTGKLGRYYTLYQLSDIENVEVLSSGNTVDIEAPSITIEAWNELNLEDPMIHGNFYEVTGTLIQKGEFNNLYLTSSESDDDILVYYYSDAESLLALETFIGRTITVELVYYTNHASNGIMAIFYGDENDIKIQEISDERKLNLDIDFLEEMSFMTYGANINLPSEGSNGTVFSNWISSHDNLIANDGTYGTLPSTPTDITFTATATLGEESSNVEITVQSLAEISIKDALDVDPGGYVWFSGKVVDIIDGNSGFFLYDETGVIYVRDTDFYSQIIQVGDSWTFVGARNDYRGSPQVTSIDFFEASNETFDDEPAPTYTTVRDIVEGNVVPGQNYLVRGTARTITEQYTNYELEDEGFSIQLHYQTNNTAISDFDGQEITIEIRPFQWDNNPSYVAYFGRADDVALKIPDALPNEPVEIVIWHAFGEGNQALLQEMFDSFNEEYPQVTITQLSQGSYDGLRESTIQSIVAGTTPTIVFGFPDHFVEYLNGNALVPLDEYIEHDIHGVNLDDFVDGFLAENRQYLDGKQYSMPFAKSTEMVFYNKDYFDSQGIELSRTIPLTWDEIEELADTMVGSGANQCDFLFNADSPSNFFINSSRQWDAGYTDGEGNILVDNADTRDMLNYFNGLFDEGIMTFPIEWDENYGSEPFKDGLVCMSQGSMAGTRFNIPDESSPFNEMGIVPVIQRDLDNASVMQQGPNVAVISDADNNQRLAAWLLLKHMTNTENTADFAMATGYVPVRKSGFETAEYQEFLSIVDKYDDVTLAGLSPSERLDLPFAMAATVAYAQVNWYQYDPAFVGRVTSSGARQEAGLAFEAIYAGTRTVEEAIERMLNQLGQ